MDSYSIRECLPSISLLLLEPIQSIPIHLVLLPLYLSWSSSQGDASTSKIHKGRVFICGGLTSAPQLSLTQPLAHFPSVGCGGESERQKWENSWIKIRTNNRQSKAAHASKANKGIHLLLPIFKQTFSHFMESRASSHATTTWKDKQHSSKNPPFFPVSSSFIPEHDVI